MPHRRTQRMQRGNTSETHGHRDDLRDNIPPDASAADCQIGLRRAML